MQRITRATVAVAAFCSTTLAHAAGFTLASPTVKPSATLPESTCPRLRLHRQERLAGAEVERRAGCTKSYALTVYDPDAPTGSGWWHWVVSTCRPGDRAARRRGQPRWQVLCRPARCRCAPISARQLRWRLPAQGHKPHRYIFTVYALKTDRSMCPRTARRRWRVS